MVSVSHEAMVLTPAQIDTLLGYSRAAGAAWRKKVGLVRLAWSSEQHPRYLREDVMRAIRGEGIAAESGMSQGIRCQMALRSKAR